MHLRLLTVRVWLTKTWRRAVSGLEIISADGSLHNLSRTQDGENFNAAVVGLGALGCCNKVTLDLKPTFKMRQYVYEKMPMSQVKEHFDKIVSAGYSVSLFTDWQSDYINEVWIKNLEKALPIFQRNRVFMVPSCYEEYAPDCCAFCRKLYRARWESSVPGMNVYHILRWDLHE